MSQQLWGLTVPPPPRGEGSQGGHVTTRPALPCSLSRASLQVPRTLGVGDRGGRGLRGAVRATVKARPRLIRVETMFPCTLRKLWIPCRQSWAEGSVWAWTAPPGPGTAPSQGVWGRSGHWDPG